MKTDFKKEIAAYSAPRGRFQIVEVPSLQFLMIDGHGDPNDSPLYTESVAALYPLAYRLKFLSKRELDRDHVVMPLEGLWWADDMASFTSGRDKSQWDWTMMIMVPPEITAGHLDRVRAEADAAPALARVRLERFDEGLCVQTLHVGSYDDEAPVLAAMHERFIPDEGLRMTGKHHEIYLGDPRRTAPEKLRTILRQPVERVGV